MSCDKPTVDSPPHDFFSTRPAVYAVGGCGSPRLLGFCSEVGFMPGTAEDKKIFTHTEHDFEHSRYIDWRKPPRTVRATGRIIRYERSDDSGTTDQGDTWLHSDEAQCADSLCG